MSWTYTHLESRQNNNNNINNNNNNKGVSVQTRFLCCVSENKTQAGDMADVDRSSGAAKRRRERRLRSWWRHERMSVEAALAEATHHSFPNGGWSEAYKAPRGPKTVSAQVEPELFELFDEEPGGAPALTVSLASGRRNGSSGHTVEHIVDQCAGRAVSRCWCAADGRAAGGCPLLRGGV